jgi:CRISPR-associated protein Cas5h
METVCFTYRAKYGHFLRAEANANGVTYPVPPRTALLGLMAAVLGLGKDALAAELCSAHVALSGNAPRRFWHKTNVRKDPPAPLSPPIKRTDKGSSSEQRNFRFPQEWLWQPGYRIWAALPEAYHQDFTIRIRDRRWHFTPCMGLSEMLADLEFVHESGAERLPAGRHTVVSLAPSDAGTVDVASAADNRLTLHSLRMPHSVTADRVFSHRGYWFEHSGNPFPFETSSAFQCGGETILFL